MVKIKISELFCYMRDYKQKLLFKFTPSVTDQLTMIYSQA